MGDLLRKPWLLPATLHALGQLESDFDDHAPPKLVQLCDVHRKAGSLNVKARISDKFNYNVAVFTHSALLGFEREFPGRSLESLRGAILKLKRFFIGTCPDTSEQLSSDPTADHIIPLVIEEFNYVAGEGSPTHGDPRYLMAVPIIKETLNLLSKQVSDQTNVTIESSFKPEDLVNIGNSSGVTTASIDLLEDSALMIPEDQQEALNMIRPESLASTLDQSLSYFLGLGPPNRTLNYSAWVGE